MKRGGGCQIDPRPPPEKNTLKKPGLIRVNFDVCVTSYMNLLK